MLLSHALIWQKIWVVSSNDFTSYKSCKTTYVIKQHKNEIFDFFAISLLATIKATKFIHFRHNIEHNYSHGLSCFQFWNKWHKKTPVKLIRIKKRSIWADRNVLRIFKGTFGHLVVSWQWKWKNKAEIAL